MIFTGGVETTLTAKRLRDGDDGTLGVGVIDLACASFTDGATVKESQTFVALDDAVDDDNVVVFGTLVIIDLVIDSELDMFTSQRVELVSLSLSQFVTFVSAFGCADGTMVLMFGCCCCC